MHCTFFWGEGNDFGLNFSPILMPDKCVSNFTHKNASSLRVYFSPETDLVNKIVRFITHRSIEPWTQKIEVGPLFNNKMKYQCFLIQYHES